MKRSEIDIKETWDISNVFESIEIYEQELERYKKLVDKFVENYEGKISDKEILVNSLNDRIEIYELVSKLSAYAGLPTEADKLDDELAAREMSFYDMYSQYNSKLSFYMDELLALDEELLEHAKTNKDFTVFIDDLLEEKSHRLHPETEKALSALSNTLNVPYRVYNDTKARDINFPDFEVDGKSYDLSYNKFEGEYEYDPDTQVRRMAFEAFSKEIGKYQHTTASVYNAQIQKEATLARLRGFDSVFDYHLLDQKVSMDLYNRQLDVVMAELAPHMRKYAGLLKQIHKLDEVHYADLKLEIDPSYSPEITFDDAKQYILDGLSILGEEYLAIMDNAFENRWIDYANNDGKSTGAFCSTPYGTPAFICMTFNNIMSDVMTLAHELGHAGHFILAHREQNILNSNPSMYFVEGPSTTNELILENYLLDLAEEKNDLRMKRWVLSQMVAKTYYHNFVTHLLEGYYQREVYKLVSQGNNLNANMLNKIFKETLEKFWADAVILDPGAELTWMRQPHYYMGLYPYTYSAGLTIGTQVARKIRAEGKPAAEKWIEVLKAGGTKRPLELAQMAGVDISTYQPLKDTISYIGSLIDEIEGISKELGEI